MVALYRLTARGLRTSVESLSAVTLRSLQPPPRPARSEIHLVAREPPECAEPKHPRFRQSLSNP